MKREDLTRGITTLGLFGYLYLIAFLLFKLFEIPWSIIVFVLVGVVFVVSYLRFSTSIHRLEVLFAFVILPWMVLIIYALKK